MEFRRSDCAEAVKTKCPLVFILRNSNNQMAISNANKFLSVKPSAARSCVLEDNGAIIFLSMMNCMNSWR